MSPQSRRWRADCERTTRVLKTKDLNRWFIIRIVRSQLILQVKLKKKHPIDCTVRDMEFRAWFFCHFKKLPCKLLFIVNVTFKSQILKFIFCSRQSYVNQNRCKRKIKVNNVKPILHFLTVYLLTLMPEFPCL
jgi:hypothetical protein